MIVERRKQTLVLEKIHFVLMLFLNSLYTLPLKFSMESY